MQERNKIDRLRCLSYRFLFAVGLLWYGDCSRHFCESFCLVQCQSDIFSFFLCLQPVSSTNNHPISAVGIWVVYFSERAAFCCIRQYRRPSRVAWTESLRPLGAILHSSNEPGELSQWLCHDDSTINIVLDIIIILINTDTTKISSVSTYWSSFGLLYVFFTFCFTESCKDRVERYVRCVQTTSL